MRKIRFTWKGIIFTFIFILLLSLSYYIGGVVGFYEGSASVSYLSDSEAYSTTLALQKLRNQDYIGTIDLLETRLDNEILHCAASENAHKSIFNLYWLLFREAQDDSHNFLLSPVANYRKKYPSTSMFPQVQQEVKAILKKISNDSD